MRLVSFNIQNRVKEHPTAKEERNGFLGAFLKSLNADLICLQEVTPSAFEWLKDFFPGKQSYFQSRNGSPPKGEGCAMFSLSPLRIPEACGHFWFSSSPEKPSRSWRAAHPRICTWMRFGSFEGTRLWVFNLHLDHRSRMARRNSLCLLQEQIQAFFRAGDQVLVCGDFNMSAVRKEIRILKRGEPPLLDAATSHPLGYLRPTYLGWGPFRLAKARIDVCLHSPLLGVEEYHALDPEWNGINISDHRALVVNLSILPRIDS